MISTVEARKMLHNEMGLIIPFSVTGYLDKDFSFQVFDLFASELSGEAARLKESGDYLSEAFYDRIHRLLAAKVDKLGYTPDYEYTHGYIASFLADTPLAGTVLPSTTCLTKLSPYRDDTQTDFDITRFPVFATVHEGAIISICGVNECDEDCSDTVEIAVATTKAARKKGYACSNLTAMTNFLIHEGYMVSYMSYHDNVPSLKLAAKAGFRLVSRDYHYVCYEKEA